MRCSRLLAAVALLAAGNIGMWLVLSSPVSAADADWAAPGMAVEEWPKDCWWTVSAMGCSEWMFGGCVDVSDCKRNPE